MTSIVALPPTLSHPDNPTSAGPVDARNHKVGANALNFASIPIVVGREADGRWWADIESMPGVMTYGNSAIANVRQLALQVAADCLAEGEVPNVGQASRPVRE